MVEKSTIPTELSTTANGPSCLARNPSGFFTTSAIFRVHWSQYQPRVSEWLPRNGKSVQSLETAYRKHKNDSSPSASVSAICADQ